MCPRRAQVRRSQSIFIVGARVPFWSHAAPGRGAARCRAPLCRVHDACRARPDPARRSTGTSESYGMEDAGALRLGCGHGRRARHTGRVRAGTPPPAAGRTRRSPASGGVQSPRWSTGAAPRRGWSRAGEAASKDDRSPRCGRTPKSAPPSGDGRRGPRSEVPPGPLDSCQIQRATSPWCSRELPQQAGKGPPLVGLWSIKSGSVTDAGSRGRTGARPAGPAPAIEHVWLHSPDCRRELQALP